MCENNGYATSVGARRCTTVADIGVRGAGYGIPGVTVDGNRVDRVYEAASEAASYINGHNLVGDGGWTCGFNRDF